MEIPEEINIKIFSYLDHESLKSLSSVSKTLRSTIFGSMELMDGSKLLIHDLKEQKKFLEKYGKSFRAVKMVKRNGQSSCGRAELVKILERIGNVRKLEIAGRTLLFRKNEVTRIPLENLRELILHDSANSYRFSQFMDGVMLEQLTLMVEKTGNYLDVNFLSWLFKQDQLKTLKIQEKAVKIFCNPFPADQITFKLKSLWIQPGSHRNGSRAAEFIFKTNFLNFLDGQVELEEIHFVASEATRYRMESSPMWREIYTRLMSSKTVKKLQIYDYCLRQITVENKTLETLIFDNPCLHMENPWENLLKLKNLKNLEISEVYRLKELFLFSESMPHLTSLKLSRKVSCGQDDSTFAQMKFPKLQELYLGNVHVNSRDWISITANCPLMKKITLNLFFLENDSVNLMMEKWAHFEELDLGCGIYTPGIFQLLNASPSFKCLIGTRRVKEHVDSAVLQDKNFRFVTKKSNVRIPQIHQYCPYQEFAKANRNILYLSMFMNNLRDFIILDV